MPKCSYCGKTYDVHKGLTLVLKDGKIRHFCSSKCRKNMSMKRRRVRWIEKEKKEKTTQAGKEEKIIKGN